MALLFCVVVIGAAGRGLIEAIGLLRLSQPAIRRRQRELQRRLGK